MKDMIPKGTGNSRFLRSSIAADITHEELVALLRSGKFPVDFAGLNSAGIQVQGSAYNKGNVLPDSVCSALGIPTTSEPKDAFLSLINSTKGFVEREKITTSKNWVCPAGVYAITAVLVAGGGGGGSGQCVYAENGGVRPYGFGGGGGQGGRCALLLNYAVTPGKSYKIIIGTGGSGGSKTTDKNGNNGTKGGETIAFGYSVEGGNPGQGAYYNNSHKPGEGGQGEANGSQGGRGGSLNGHYGGMGGINIEKTVTIPDNNMQASYALPQIFTDLLFGDWYGAGGGGGANADKISATGGFGGDHAGNGGDYASSKAEDGENGENGFGAGGGGGAGNSMNNTAGAGGKGGNGAVILYY